MPYILYILAPFKQEKNQKSSSNNSKTWISFLSHHDLPEIMKKFFKILFVHTKVFFVSFCILAYFEYFV